MKEVHEGIWVGDASDYEVLKEEYTADVYYIVQACKEPYHREALGYTGRAAPKDHPEYLMARRDNRLILNMIDAHDPAYIPKEIVDAALAHTAEGIRVGKPVFIHCNQGGSRSPGLALLFMAIRGWIPNESYDAAKEAFLKIYPGYDPGKGVEGFLKQNWSEYCGGDN